MTTSCNCSDFEHAIVKRNQGDVGNLENRHTHVTIVHHVREVRQRLHQVVLACLCCSVMQENRPTFESHPNEPATAAWTRTEPKTQRATESVKLGGF